MLIKVEIKLKDSILDPEGQTILNALNHKGYDFVNDVRTGKIIELETDDNTGYDEDKIKSLCESVLTNPIIEDYKILK